MSNEFDWVYAGEDAEELMVITMTRRQWWHLDDWRAEHPDRYPKRAAERNAAWAAIEAAGPLGPLKPNPTRSPNHDRPEPE